MEIHFKDITLYAEEFSTGRGNNPNTILFLHGFTGSTADWRETAALLPDKYRMLGLDFAGHGKSDAPENLVYYSPQSIVEQINYSAEKLSLKDFFLIGYSMGGRAALCYTVEHQHRLKGLILESSTAGITDVDQKEARISRDENLAEFIDKNSIERFTDYWINLDLFRSQKNLPKVKLAEIRRLKLLNNKKGLSNSLKGFGTGRMPSIFNKLNNIKLPTLLITGELDVKFTQINRELNSLIPSASHQIIKNAGHNTHLEKPILFANSINSFINQFQL